MHTTNPVVLEDVTEKLFTKMGLTHPGADLRQATLLELFRYMLPGVTDPVYGALCGTAQELETLSQVEDDMPRKNQFADLGARLLALAELHRRALDAAILTPVPREPRRKRSARRR